jgi:hypothetical protein
MRNRISLTDEHNDVIQRWRQHDKLVQEAKGENERLTREIEQPRREHTRQVELKIEELLSVAEDNDILVDRLTESRRTHANLYEEYLLLERAYVDLETASYRRVQTRNERLNKPDRTTKGTADYLRLAATAYTFQNVNAVNVRFMKEKDAVIKELQKVQIECTTRSSELVEGLELALRKQDHAHNEQVSKLRQELALARGVNKGLSKTLRNVKAQKRNDGTGVAGLKDKLERIKEEKMEVVKRNYALEERNNAEIEGLKAELRVAKSQSCHVQLKDMKLEMAMLPQ